MCVCVWRLSLADNATFLPIQTISPSLLSLCLLKGQSPPSPQGRDSFLPSSPTKKKEQGGGQASQGAHGQLIVSGNVFHLHVYTVNSGGGL